MRGLRSTLVLVVVLAGLFAYIYFVTWKQPADDALKQDKVYASLETDKIEEIRVKSPTGDTTVKKTAGAWQVVAPITAAADEAKASGVGSSLTGLTVTRVVEENPADLKEYGLSEPRIDVGFKLAGDADYRHLLIGDKSPTGSDVFAKRGDEKRVILLASYQEANYSLSTFDLRDKTALKFDRDKIDGVEVNSGALTMRFSKVGTDWKIAAPRPLRTDSPSVDGLLNRLQTMQMKSAETENATPADLTKFGLDKPQVTLNLNTGSARASLLLGKPTDSSNSAVYARDASKNVVMTIDAMLAEDMKKGVDQFRQMTLFDFKPYNANRLEIARGGQSVVFEKVKGADDKTPDKWRRVSPNPGDVDKDKMDAFVQKLSDMRAASFVNSTAKTGLASPVMTVTAKFEDNKKEERVAFGKVENDAFASLSPGEPGAAKFDAPALNETLTALDELSK